MVSSHLLPGQSCPNLSMEGQQYIQSLLQHNRGVVEPRSVLCPTEHGRECPVKNKEVGRAMEVG